MYWAWPKLVQLDTCLGLWEILAEAASWQILFVTPRLFRSMRNYFNTFMECFGSITEISVFWYFLCIFCILALSLYFFWKTLILAFGTFLQTGKPGQANLGQMTAQSSGRVVFRSLGKARCQSTGGWYMRLETIALQWLRHIGVHV